MLGARVGDALYLAICTDKGAILWTLNRGLGEAGLKLRVKSGFSHHRLQKWKLLLVQRTGSAFAFALLPCGHR
jgi:hypothetical protein